MELLVTTDVGPRILRCGFAGDANLFFEAESDLGRTGGDTWRPYGGHRLWHAPEAVPRTYAPDNAPVDHSWDGKVLSLRQPPEISTGISKEICVSMSAARDHVRVTHRMTNNNLWAITTAAWCLTVVAPGGRAMLPQEPFVPFPEKLLPARPLVLWSYTNMADPRFTWGRRCIQLWQHPNATDCQKIGLLNSAGWGAYELNGSVFLKHAAFIDGQEYPDFGCNWELYTNPAMLELETLSPYTTIAPGETLEHTENWCVARLALDSDEEAMVQQLHSLMEFPADNR